jgi:hypothetical protein
MNFDLFKKKNPKILKKNPHTLGDAILANANNCKVAPVTPVETRCALPIPESVAPFFFSRFPFFALK